MRKLDFLHAPQKNEIASSVAMFCLCCAVRRKQSNERCGAHEPILNEREADGQVDREPVRFREVEEVFGFPNIELCLRIATFQIPRGSLYSCHSCMHEKRSLSQRHSRHFQSLLTFPCQHVNGFSRPFCASGSRGCTISLSEWFSMSTSDMRGNSICAASLVSLGVP